MQREHVSDPAEPGLLSAKRGGSTPFQKGEPLAKPTVAILQHSIFDIFLPSPER